MYCKYCGVQLPDDARFCSGCGKAQEAIDSQKNEKKPRKAFLAGVVSCALLVLLFGLFAGGNEDDQQLQKQTEPAATAASSVAMEETETVPQLPQNGWHEENGKRYYYSDGEALTGLQEISNAMYYFGSDGILAVNTHVDINGNILEADRSGQITAVTFAIIDGEWSSEKYRFGNNGTSSVKELNTEVENCDRTGFRIEANGLRGAKVSGNWKIYVRSHGTWVFAKEVYFQEPSGTFEIRFDHPMDFDAITAYPTVKGNASYSSYFCLTDVHMGL